MPTFTVRSTLRDLPVGSHLDTASGTFTWAPAPGYLGTYHLVFVGGGPSTGLGTGVPRPARADTGSPLGAGSTASVQTKPSNTMLHAFRARQCPFSHLTLSLPRVRLKNT